LRKSRPVFGVGLDVFHLNGFALPQSPPADRAALWHYRHGTNLGHELLRKPVRFGPVEDPVNLAGDRRLVCRRRRDQVRRTVCKSNAERLMTLSTSAVAVCCASASSRSRVFACTIATRHDKLTKIFLAGVQLACAAILLN
jgi:hypothetical protein